MSLARKRFCARSVSFRPVEPKFATLERRELLTTYSTGFPVAFQRQDSQVAVTRAVRTYDLGFDPTGNASIEDHATIDWGDGSTVEPATLSFIDGAGGHIMGQHAYASDGAYQAVAHVFVRQTLANGVDFGLASLVEEHIAIKITASPAYVLASPGPTNIYTYQGYTLESFNLTNLFTNIQNPQSVFSVTVDWGDGTPLEHPLKTTPDVGEINGQQVFTEGIYGQTHQYLRSGEFTITVTAKGDGLVATSTAHAKIAPVSGPFFFPLQNSVIGETYGVYDVLTVKYFGGLGPLTSVTFDWGDGTTSEARKNGFDQYDPGAVTGEHKYESPGLYTVHIRLTDSNGSTGETTQLLDVRPDVFAFETHPIHTIAGLDAGTVLATLKTWPVGSVPLIDQNATHPALMIPYYGTMQYSVDWGDGTPISKVAQGLTTPFPVPFDDILPPDMLMPGSASLALDHAFERPGLYDVVVTATNLTSGHSYVAHVPATVDVFPATAFPIHGQAGTQINPNLLADAAIPNGSLNVGDYTASIDWGDGQPTSSGTISVQAHAANTGFPFSLADLVVGGSHTYATGGSYTVSITLTDSTGRRQVFTTVATIDPKIQPKPTGHYVLVSRFGHPETKRVWVPDTPPTPPAHRKPVHQIATHSVKLRTTLRSALPRG